MTAMDKQDVGPAPLPLADAFAADRRHRRDIYATPILTIKTRSTGRFTYPVS
jgi:hypothetical protein